MNRKTSLVRNKENIRPPLNKNHRKKISSQNIKQHHNLMPTMRSSILE